MLGVTAGDVLEWVEQGKLQTFGGAPRNPFVRTAEVEKLAAEMGRDLQRPPAKKRVTQDPVKRVELRIRHDTRWAEVTEANIRAWAKGLDASTRAAARTVAETARDRLGLILAALSEPSRTEEEENR